MTIEELQNQIDSLAYSLHLLESRCSCIEADFQYDRDRLRELIDLTQAENASHAARFNILEQAVKNAWDVKDVTDLL